MTSSTVVCASYNLISICDCSLNKNPYEQYRNYTCGDPSNISLDCSQCFINKKTISAKIQNQVYVPQSQRNSVLNSSTIAFDSSPKLPPNSSSIWGNNNYLRNQSDRNVPHHNKFYNINVPSRGSSTTTSITRNRPGSLAPGGTGVDVKHGSYQRYLAKKKANNIFSNINGNNLKSDILTTQESLHDVALVNNNKQYRFNIIAVGNCCPQL